MQDGEAFIPREDEEVSAAVLEHMTAAGMRILRKAAVTAVRDENGKAIASIRTEGGEEELSVDAILVATGRRPNLAELHPERAGYRADTARRRENR